MKNTNMLKSINTCHDTAIAVDKYINKYLFDSSGIMYSRIDSHTGKTFAKDFITPIKVPRRAAFDPWSYWTFEDSVMSMGLYLDGLVLQYKVTGDCICLERANVIWKVIKEIYSCSQVYGIGTFLRPYGGFETMGQFMEPLGTDQASTLFSGLYRYLPYTEPKTAAEIRRVMINMLMWYEQQGFAYFYYKSFIHEYSPEVSHSNHANSFYLQGIAWAAENFPEVPYWQQHLNERLGYFEDERYNMYPKGSYQPAFCWGSDLDVLNCILGVRLFKVFNNGLLDKAYQEVNEVLLNYREHGIVRRICPESTDPDFKAYITQLDHEKDKLGFAYRRTCHHGRTRPRCEINFLLGLASIGYRTQEIIQKVAELINKRSSVPADFTAFLSEDYHLLPETVHLYARSVGSLMVEWWRNYWLLRYILIKK